MAKRDDKKELDDEKDGITPGKKLIPLSKIVGYSRLEGSIKILKAFFKPDELVITSAKKIKDKIMAEVKTLKLVCEIKNDTKEPLNGAFLAVKESVVKNAPLFELLSTEYFKRTKKKTFIKGSNVSKNPIKVGAKRILTWAIPVSKPDEISDAFFNKLEAGKEAKLEGIDIGVIGVTKKSQKIVATSKTEDIMVKQGPILKVPPRVFHIVKCPHCQSDISYDGLIPDEGIEVACYKCHKLLIITKDEKTKPSKGKPTVKIPTAPPPKSKMGVLVRAKTSNLVYFCLPGTSEGETPPAPKDPPAYVVEPGKEVFAIRRCTILNLTDEKIQCTGVRIWGENTDTGEKFGSQKTAAAIVSLALEVKPQSRSIPFVLRIPLDGRLRPLALGENIILSFEVTHI